MPDLLANTFLIRASFLLEAPMQEMRDPSRCAPEQVVREHVSHVQRIQNTLKDVNLEFASMACPAALQDDPDKLLTLMQRARQCPAEAGVRRPSRAASPTYALLIHSTPPLRRSMRR